MDNTHVFSTAVWSRALIIAFFVLAIFFYWFAIADRYAVFLYGHLGATPFDEVTRSRYWMAGLVAAGYVLCGGLICERIAAVWAQRRRHCYPKVPWRSVWGACSLLLMVGIPLIVMNVNEPVLPPLLAAACVVVTTSGLALAFMPLSLVATAPGTVVWLAAEGLGLLPLLFAGLALALPARGLMTWAQAWAICAAGLAATVSARLVVDWGRLRSGRPLAELRRVIVAGFCWAYLVLPLLHHLLATPPDYRYISTATNFFAANLVLQSTIWLATYTLTAGMRSLVMMRHRPVVGRAS